jgi:hypothetical protein
VWHGTDSCAVTIHPFDLDNIPQHVPAALFANRAVQQNDDARAAQQNEQKLEAKAAAKDRLVQAITQAKVGKGVPLLPVPQI